jgi:hypothetical protein
MLLIRLPRWIQCLRVSFVCQAFIPSFELLAQEQGKDDMKQPTLYRAQVDGLSSFYREVGPKGAPTILHPPSLHRRPAMIAVFCSAIQNLVFELR